LVAPIDGRSFVVNKWSIMLVFLLMSCGMPIEKMEPLAEKLLRVTEIRPADGEELLGDSIIEIRFSKGVDPQSLDSENIYLVVGETLPEDDEEIINGDAVIEEDGLAVRYQLPTDMLTTGFYSIVLTNGIQSTDGYPLALPAFDEPLKSLFYISGEGGAGNVQGGSGSGGSNDPSGSGSSEGGSQEEISLPRPSYLLINEIYYDVPGSDTNGEVFIELRGEVGGCLKGYHLALINGGDGKTYKSIAIDEDGCIVDDGLYLIADTDSNGSSQIENADLLVNFDPQNGPDAIQLIDPDGQLVDVIGYGDLTISTAGNGLPTFEGSPTPKSGSGKSLSRLEDGIDTDNNIVDFIINDSPTPGSMDSGGAGDE